jgi:hypothetical protein
MKPVYLLLLLLLAGCFGSSAQQSESGFFPSKQLAAMPDLRIRTNNPDTSNNILYVLDGIPVDAATLTSQLDVYDIESIHVLKDSMPNMISCRSLNKVIIITTKTATLPVFYALDQESGLPLPGATVVFRSEEKNDSLIFIAGDDGRVRAKKLRPGTTYQVTISSAGYKTLSAAYTVPEKREVKTFKLMRDVKENAGVVISASSRHIICNGWFSCSTPGVLVTSIDTTPGHVAAKDKMLRVFPNPVRRNAVVTVEMNSAANAALRVQLFNASGALIRTMPYTPVIGLNRIDIPIAGEWTAGMYFIQLVSQQNKPVGQERFIVH